MYLGDHVANEGVEGVVMAVLLAVTDATGAIVVGLASAAATALGAWALIRNKTADVNQSTAEWLVTEMRAEVGALKAEVAALRAENAELRTTIRSLEDKLDHLKGEHQ